MLPLSDEKWEMLVTLFDVQGDGGLKAVLSMMKKNRKFHS